MSEVKTPMNAGLDEKDGAADEQPGHVKLDKGVYGWGRYKAKCILAFCRNLPALAGNPVPLSSHMLSVYEPCASGTAPGRCSYSYGSHVTCVAEPGITPFVGPIGYVFPFSGQKALRVSTEGWTRSEVKFQPKVMV